MKAELAEMKKKQEQIDSGLEMSNSKLAEEIKKRKKAEREAEKLKAQLAFAKKNKFGKKQQKVTKCETDKSCEEDPDRTDTYNAMGVHGEPMKHLVIFFYKDGSRGRDVLVNFLGDAELKSIHNLTTQRNSMLHFGSDEGVEWRLRTIA